MKRPKNRRAPQTPVKVRRLPHARDLPLPAYQSSQSAGMDLVAAIPQNEETVLAPGSRALIPTGLIFELPAGTEAQVRPRSGLAAKYGVTVLNSPGTIDADYRGEVAVILINLGTEPFTVRRGDRVAQLIIAPVSQANLTEATVLSQTARGAGGFGSTGTKVGNTASSKAAGCAKRKSVAQSARKPKIAASKPKPSKPR